MKYGIRYFVEYEDVTEDDEKEMSIVRVMAFESVLDAAKWTRVLPSQCRVLNKFKTETDAFNVFDESEFDVAVSRVPNV